MFSRATARRKPAALKRNLLGLLSLLWLSMTVLPCAMAFESSEICPHCPPVDEQEMASHHSHGEVQAKASCATTQSQCCDLEEASVDARGGKLEVKPPSEVVFVTAPAIPRLPALASAQGHCAADPPDTPRSSPPLHVLHCVYLK